MIIQWFPGHMTKTQKLIQELKPTVDVFMELLDARAPASCRNPLLDTLIGGKPRVILLTKTDLADPVVTLQWKQYFGTFQDTRVLLISSKERQNIHVIPQTCVDLLNSVVSKPRTFVRGMIVGIPNVGKSTLINTLVGARKTGVAPKPGHTRGIQKIRLTESFELVDTPGILWHKFEDMQVGQRLAMLGSIKDDVYDFLAVCLLTIDFLTANYPQALALKYRITGTNPEPNAILEEIARKRGFILPGGLLDLDRACVHVMNDFRSGGLGRMSLEKPPK